MARFLRRLILLFVVLGGVAAAVIALRGSPIPVETAVARREAMQVTVDEDGKTRIKERYTVSAPLAGRLRRIALKEGDAVTAGVTILASIEPADPSLLDPRARAEALARQQAAEAGIDRTTALLQRSNAELELAQSELKRVEAARTSEAATQQELDRARSTESMRLRDRQAAEFACDIARFELALAKAAMLRTGPDANPGEEGRDWRFDITAPVDGRVLRVFQESAAVVPAGAPLIEVGDPSDLELVVDVLSRDGVAIREGAPVRLEQWGGEKPLRGSVRKVEPAAFTKISALGVEEQRVNVIIDFLDPPQDRKGLGDAFRVEARIETWSANDVLTVPTGALFRHASSWAVFAIRDGVAEMRNVDVGQRNGTQAQILSGLEAGDQVVVYPSDRVRDGVRVTPRG
ncbi:MAG: HlyD family efflux transporter periplasmic adaptor subunit [Phycisphaerales bacterium]